MSPTRSPSAPVESNRIEMRRAALKSMGRESRPCPVAARAVSPTATPDVSTRSESPSEITAGRPGVSERPDESGRTCADAIGGTSSTSRKTRAARTGQAKRNRRLNAQTPALRIRRPARQRESAALSTARR